MSLSIILKYWLPVRMLGESSFLVDVWTIVLVFYWQVRLGRLGLLKVRNTRMIIFTFNYSQFNLSRHRMHCWFLLCHVCPLSLLCPHPKMSWSWTTVIEKPFLVRFVSQRYANFLDQRAKFQTDSSLRAASWIVHGSVEKTTQEIICLFLFFFLTN